MTLFWLIAAVSAAALAAWLLRPFFARARGAERHANADLARALLHAVRDHAVEADRRQQERKAGEDTAEGRNQTFPLEVRVDVMREGPDLRGQS